MAAIFGIGVDIVDIDRMAELRQRHGERFEGLLFTRDEYAYCMARAKPDECLAARFAAKEAMMKALGTGWANGVSFVGIEVVRCRSGKPEIRLHGTTLAYAERAGAGEIHLSLSHSRTSAMAQVVVEKKESPPGF